MTKVLIVEDEIVLRQGIISLINWSQLGCEVVGDCSNGSEAVSFLNAYPVDLVITDIKMPGMDGLELASHISKLYPETGVILLSAYSDFEYAQKAIRCGIFNYVLKNTFVKDLPPAITSAIKKMKQKREKLTTPGGIENQVRIKPVVVRGILDGTISDEEEIRQWISYCRINLNYFFVVWAEIDNSEQADFTRKQLKVSASVQRFFDLAFKDYSHLCISLSDNTLFTLINFDSNQESSHLRSLVMVCNEILSTVKNYMTFDCNIGVSNQHSRPSEIRIAGEEAQYALGRVFVNTSIALYQDAMGGEFGSSLPNIQRHSEIILNDIALHDTGALSSHIYEIFEEYRSAIDDLEKLRIETMLLVSICLRRLTENNIHIVDSGSLEQNITARIMQCQSINSICRVVERAFSDIVKLDLAAPTHYNHLVVQVNNFIKENYSLPIRLDDISSLLHVNSSYLSRLYKKETGDSIITALNKYRISKAKELLKGGEHLVSEVGYMVGIEDPAYFANVFTKYTGVSPKSYKAEM